MNEPKIIGTCPHCGCEIEEIQIRTTRRLVEVIKQYVNVVTDAGIVTRGRPIHSNMCSGGWRKVGE